ncbi:Chitinase domain-containing protein 1 [Hordeum vulgare]|nr:Chitinase domain-containing protein 1 [Hordeum vulgare]
MGWREFLLGCSLGDRTKFEDTMEVCLNFTSKEEVHKEADNVVKKEIRKELKTLIPDQTKDAMLVDIPRWAMNQADSGDARQRAKWDNYRE